MAQTTKLEEGLYQAEIQSWKLGRNENTGNFQLALRVSVHTQYDDPEDIEGSVTPVSPARVRTVFMPITEKTKDRVIAELKSIGYPHDELKAQYLNPDHEDGVDLKAVSEGVVRLNLSYEEWKGKEIEKWGISRRKQTKKATLEEASQFDQMFGGPSSDPQ